MKVGYSETLTNGSEVEDDQWRKEGKMKKIVCGEEEFTVETYIVNIVYNIVNVFSDLCF
jgi:hypothetical protein